jgi:pimeloyl-ACP methyl ester carboxylesterase
MNILSAAAMIVLFLTMLMVGVTYLGAWLVEREHPPAGAFTAVNGTRIHHVHRVPDAEAAILPPVVFIHGASGNLLDQMVPVLPLIEGRAELLFVDRPGHGWSQRGSGNEDPYGQAATIAALMDALDIDSAIVVGHSFGGAVAAALALNHPLKVRGLVFLSPATHPWPGANTSWYYSLAAMPLIGPLFVRALAVPAGHLVVERASAGVFAPNRKPASYVAQAAIRLVLRPASFRWNAIDVEGLYDHVVEAAPRYREIKAPTVVVSGNRDTVVYEEIHSLGLARDIPGSDLIWIDNLGHKPDWIAPDLVVAAIEQASGAPVDMPEVIAGVRARIAGDAYGPSEPRADDPELSPAQ